LLSFTIFLILFSFCDNNLKDEETRKKEPGVRSGETKQNLITGKAGEVLSPPNKETALPKGSPKNPKSLPLTMKEAVVLALRNNLELMGFRYDPLIAQEDIIRAESVFDPVTVLRFDVNESNINNTIARTKSDNLSADAEINKKFYTGGTYGVGFDTSRNRVSGGTLGTQLANPVNPITRSDLFLNFTQPLLLGFGRDVNRAQIEISINLQKIAALGLNSQIRDLIAGVETSYLDLLQALRTFEVSKKSLGVAEDLLAQNKIRVRVGTMAPIEVLQAEAGKAAREEAVIIAQSNIETFEELLKRQIFPLEESDLWSLNIEPSDKPIVQKVQPDLDAALESTLATDPQYQQAKLNVSNRDINLKVARNLTLPTLNLQGNVRTAGIRGEVMDDFDPLFRGDSSAWQVGLNFSYPLGNRDAKSQVRQGEMQLEKSKLSVKQAEYTLTVQVRDLIRQVNTNLERVRTTGISSRLAEENLAAERKKLEVGLSTSFQVLQFEERLTIARNAENLAIIDYNKSIINLERVTGQILEKFNITTKY
ncbi:MAG: TolC family protein, partial [Candidatus Tectomicrobia bacterium]|nr:TolC family protein [Candidatus Tectomicrobia bacterium]